MVKLNGFTKEERLEKFKQAQALLSEYFDHYVILTLDPNGALEAYDSNIVAHGLMNRELMYIQNNWNPEPVVKIKEEYDE